MFNLIVSANEEEWEKSSATLFGRRMFEYTSNKLKKRFDSLEGADLRELLALPCLFVYETGVEKPARVGRVLEVRQRDQSDSLKVHFEIDPSFPPIDPSRIEELSWEIDIGAWELNRTHWAVKDVDLVAELVNAGAAPGESSLSAGIESQEWSGITVNVNPKVFKIPALPRDRRPVLFELIMSEKRVLLTPHKPIACCCPV